MSFIKIYTCFLLLAFFLPAQAAFSVSQKTRSVLLDLERMQSSSFRQTPAATCTLYPDGSTPLITVEPSPPSNLSVSSRNEFIREKVDDQLYQYDLMISRLRGGTGNESSSFDDVYGRINRDALIPTIEALNADMNDTGRAFYTQRQREQLPLALVQARSLLSELEERQRTLQFCEFKRQIDNEIRTISGDRSHHLQILDSITWCLGQRQIASGQIPDSMVDMANPVFDSIFFEYSNKESLTDEDCTVLERTYQAWSSFYDRENEAELSTNNPIPLYNVNPHNSSYFYWMKEAERGNIPREGLTLLHADTHTDLGHIHDHIRDDVFSRLRSQDIRPLLINLRHGKETFLSSLENYLRSNNYRESDYRVMLNAFRSQTTEEIRNSLETLARRSVHEIAQPLVGAVNAGLTDRLIMCLPPWSPRLPRSNINNGEAEFQDLTLASRETQNKIELTSTDSSLTSRNDSPIRSFERGVHRSLRTGIGLATTNCNEEVSERSSNRVSLPGFESFMGERERENGFILDIDLDVFVSEGYSSSELESSHSPRSWQRTVDSNNNHNQQNGAHGGHDQSNETDSRIQVSSNELLLIKERVDNFFDRLESAKNQGILPRVITISDSTILNRMIEGQNDDSLSGGNFTPSCLAFLLNYMVRRRLGSLYQVNERFD